ncbi:cytochrome c biogenesis heme-transporting ATPase CcmA [Pseudidiomarina terrestris]|uniref:cytochrome c biogenesis heme-transporting ATPase CcmA n=1 Tax=Pseudidiomarina terrestris TaxID=2820060 RepID=UPI002651A343|nr:cytochrome c biogenesis heme-transporting ATPase CcmA [Pseudidiomarina sp. 1ASP75-5]MDN7134638.1 cytochrome c biogenesis heme-transporting ATPase CcmA [Pseudidiomarina sp. 1ASP75-5]
MSTLLTAKQLSSQRAGRALFSDLSFTVQRGDVLHIEGVNGAGKSTLLRALVGLVQLQSGQIEFFPDAADDHDWRNQLLFMGHKAGIKAELTAIENLTLQAKLCGCAIDDAWQLLATVGLLGLEDVPAGQLSAGQQRRIALTRLWYSNVPLWILDEPFTALDTDGIELLQQRFAEHTAAGGAIIMTSHQPLTWTPTRLQRLRINGGDA